jgi:hypothetical protein
VHPHLQNYHSVRLVFPSHNRTSQCLESENKFWQLLIYHAWKAVKELIIINGFHHCGFIFPTSSTVDTFTDESSLGHHDNIFYRVTRFLQLPRCTKPKDYLSVDDSPFLFAPWTAEDITAGASSPAFPLSCSLPACSDTIDENLDNNMN